MLNTAAVEIRWCRLNDNYNNNLPSTLFQMVRTDAVLNLASASLETRHTRLLLSIPPAHRPEVFTVEAVVFKAASVPKTGWTKQKCSFWEYEHELGCQQQIIMLMLDVQRQMGSSWHATWLLTS